MFSEKAEVKNRLGLLDRKDVHRSMGHVSYYLKCRRLTKPVSLLSILQRELLYKLLPTHYLSKTFRIYGRLQPAKKKKITLAMKMLDITSYPVHSHSFFQIKSMEFQELIEKSLVFDIILKVAIFLNMHVAYIGLAQLLRNRK